MGLLRALTGIPLAPLRGLVGMARHLQQQSEEEQARQLVALQAELLELQFLGEEERLADKEAELLAKIEMVVGARK